MEANELTTRPITGADELGLFSQLPYTLNEELAEDLAAGRRRPEWMWMALRGDRLLARAAWWSRPGSDTPQILDILDIDDRDGAPAADRRNIGVRLLNAATAAALPKGSQAPRYSRFVPPDWREDAAVRRAVQDRRAVLETTGARFLVERLRLEWRQGTPVPEPRGRLDFRQVNGAEEVVALMTSVLEGTLDAHDRQDLERMSPHDTAVGHYRDELARYTSPRAWWRIATLPHGEPVGLVVPAHNGYNPVVAYIAVLPRHRGNGYVDDILAEGTRVLSQQGFPRIRASTDLDNTPMADAFRRAGYLEFEREINMTWS